MSITKSDEGLVSAVAEAIHDGWWFSKRQYGYTFAPFRSREGKTHPHLTSWLVLAKTDPRNHDKDKQMARKAVEWWCQSSENNQQNNKHECLAKLMHTWSIECMETVERDSHPHAKDTWESHDEEGRHEHLTQAEFVLNVLNQLAPQV